MIYIVIGLLMKTKTVASLPIEELSWFRFFNEPELFEPDLNHALTDLKHFGQAHVRTVKSWISTFIKFTEEGFAGRQQAGCKMFCLAMHPGRLDVLFGVVLTLFQCSVSTFIFERERGKAVLLLRA